MLFPTTLVGSYPQPDWLIDRAQLAKQMPPRVRARELWRVAPEHLEAAQDDATLIAIRDQERAGGFEPLRFLPKGNKMVVLGLITSKSGTLEKKDDVKRRIDEAAKFAPLEQFCLSPQCGFASTEEGNILAEEEQWAKLRMVVDLSKEVWG